MTARNIPTFNFLKYKANSHPEDLLSRNHLTSVSGTVHSDRLIRKQWLHQHFKWEGEYSSRGFQRWSRHETSFPQDKGNAADQRQILFQQGQIFKCSFTKVNAKIMWIFQNAPSKTNIIIFLCLPGVRKEKSWPNGKNRMKNFS